MEKERKKNYPLDKDLLYRWFHLHCFSHIFRILTSKQPKNEFAYPRFKLFKDILWQESHERVKFSLFLRVLITFWKEVASGAFITVFFSCLNLLIPLMIKNFLHFMHEHHVDQNEISSTEILIEGFIVLQVLRIIFGEHSKRLFHELAIKVQSSLSLMIVKKSLSISHDVRNRISQSEILQLENIDLKLVFVMFQNMYTAIQAPFTILLTIYLLYLQNYKYGLIGIYWFVIAFLVQRELDSKMKHCNDTKLKLIEARSKINYEIIGKIRTAKLLGHEQLLIQKNNDYFIAQNHDHKMFYEYATLYDISLLMLPILVIVTIALYDMNEPNPISVSQVYVLLSLLGICYGPMKSFRTLTLNFHDGLRSIRRIQQFLKHPDQPKNERLKLRFSNSSTNPKNARKGSTESDNEQRKPQQSTLPKYHTKSRLPANWPLLSISKNLLVNPVRQKTRIKLNISMEQNMHFHQGQRLVVVGKVGSGIEAFFEALIGMAKIDEGEITLNERIAYLNEQHFFRNTTIRENIRFFNKQISDEQIESVYKLLKLDEDLKLTSGLEGNIDDQYKYNSVQLHKISLARVLCSKAEIYLMDKVFQPLNAGDEDLLEQILRQKQTQEGKLVILLNYPNNVFEDNDRIMIFEKGTIKAFKTYKEMIDTKNADFRNFYHVQTEKEKLDTERQMDIFSHFGTKLSLNFNSLERTMSTYEKEKVIGELANPILVYAVHMWKQYKQQTHKKLTNYGIRHYILKFLSAIKLREFLYIFLIITVAQMMHIFIHFYIGHLEEEHGENNYIKFRDMIIVEFVLTIGLAGIIWLEGEVSSEIAIIQGHNLYKDALTSLGQNKLSWFENEYSVKIANRFNHDYEEAFIMLHMLLNIYKNMVILVATIYFLAESKMSLIIMTFGITVTYLTVYWILRSVQRKVVNYFEEYKYHYVRVLEESIGGAKLIELHGASDAVLENAKLAYKEFASYKIAESYTAYGEQIFCDLVSLVIFTAVLNYGLQSKVEGNTKSIAEVATMIHLLIGVFDVLKTIVKDSVNFETFFKINLLPFVQIIKQKTPETLVVEEYIEKSIIQFEEEVIKKSEEIIRGSLTESNKSIEGIQVKVPPIDFSNVLGKMGESVEGKQNLSTPSKSTPSKSVQKQFSRCKIKRTLSVEKIISPYIKYDIEFRNVILHESKYHEPVFEVYPLSVKIGQGETVLFYEQNDYLKNYLIYALTKNLPMFFNPEIMALERTQEEIMSKDKTVLIGGRDICCIEKQQLSKIVQILIDHDFYIDGTLEDNIAWKNHNYDPKQVLQFAEYLQFSRQLPLIKKYGLRAPIHEPSKDLIKKMTLLRILSLKPKIIIIKDTESIIENFLLIQQIQRLIGSVTIIKISSNIDEAFDIERIIYTKNLQIEEDRLKSDAIKNPFSVIGDELRKANLSGMIYANKMNATLIGAKFGNGTEVRGK